ncbi:MAG TPA: aldehyde dehydrogenase family protein, partial [Polyangiaceae bacterium]|nr:aldehyde dehydrogenase family protein [Polyangiaceae bacterium]
MSAKAAMLSVFQAFDRVKFAEVPTDDARALEAKLERARLAFADRDAWPKPHERAAVLLRMSQLLAERRDDFRDLIAREGGKPHTDATVEVTRAIDGLRNAADELRSFGGQEIPMGLTPASDRRWAFTVREPIGIVAAISAFNHPLNLIVHQVAPAIAVGCPVIVKPASTTPLCCLELVKLAHAAGLPEAWCQSYLPPDTAGAEKLASDARVAFLSFIGSAKVGWHLRTKLAPGTRCALEHGGAAPVIVDRDVDLDAIVEPIVKGGYYHAGQVCVSVQRIFVHADVCDAFSDRLAKRVGELRVGDPLKPETEVGPLILPKEVARVASWVEEATRTGARVTVGGHAASETTYQPTVLLEPAPDAKVSREEVFGPVTCLYRFTDLDQAIAAANRLPLAFQA